MTPTVYRQTTPPSRTTLRVVLENTVRGHRFPTGSAFFRELWVRLRVSDAAGSVVFDSADASLRDEAELSELWFGHLAAGRIKVEIGLRYGLEDCVQAHRDLEAGKSIGSSVFVL